MNSKLKESTSADIPTIVEFLADMRDELKELEFNKHTAMKTISKSLDEHVHWFLFYDENDRPFGTCHLQSLYNYWRSGKRFYLGGFYISPSHREKGRFKELYNQLKKWAESNGGVEMFSSIHKNNERSLRAFVSVGFKKGDWCLCINHWGE